MCYFVRELCHSLLIRGILLGGFYPGSFVNGALSGGLCCELFCLEGSSCRIFVPERGPGVSKGVCVQGGFVQAGVCTMCFVREGIFKRGFVQELLFDFVKEQF